MNGAAVLRALLAVLVAGSGQLTAQAGIGPDPETRARLSVSYLRVDRRFREMPPPAELLGPFNRAFDGATLSFFAGRYEQAIATLDSLANSLGSLGDAEAERAQLVAAMAGWDKSRRLLPVGGETVPYQLVLPRGAKGPRPLLIALHGAGADERAFLEAYGAGRLRELADRHGLILVTPLTPSVIKAPGEAFDRLVRAAEAFQEVDHARVYLLGHSLGAGAAWSMALERGHQIGAVACLAGVCGGPPGTGGPAAVRIPPTLVYGAALDPLATPARLETAVRRGREAGYPVEGRTLPEFGHTLMVGVVLDEVVGWLLRQPAAQ